jgi:hypothetical protein
MRDMVRDWIKDQENECCEYFEKSKNEALSALDAERAEHAQVKKQLLDLNSRIQDELNAAKFSLNDVQSLVGIQQEEVANLKQRIAELEAHPYREYQLQLARLLHTEEKEEKP